MSAPATGVPRGNAAEGQLVERLRRGDARAYRELYDRCGPRLLGIIDRLFGDHALAEDAVQATFLIIFQQIEQFDGRSALLTWMTRIAIREAHRLARPAPVPAAGPGEPPRPPSPEEARGAREL